MTLLKCSECNKEMSSKATTCPNCGAPMKRKSGCLGNLFFGLSAFLFIIFLIGLVAPKTPTPPQTSETETPPSQNKEIETQEQKAKAEEEKVKQLREVELNKQRDAEINTKIEKFKQWALNNTSVTDIAITGKITMLVTLTPDKYTNRDDVRVIAETLARAYANQVGIDFAVCHVYYGNEEYVKGEFSR
ncbi:zinc-ribbon domain-containing protein [Anabaena sp. FACHB-1250]|jgi:rRNA maturation endonuclease Nob1|uniref:zinc ribbon domain-containing protein n=1 Tax=Anabaena sp. FACHB-1250 TaxID=2692770 RepID=UPI001680CCA7|nr:zinc ribbon domain-containing protein [Anabaena sp. FACHB-1250]MBD2142945.1 zinc-ribbon domain-containing protein [Anabaena sp. FACHB-1250]